MAHLDQASEVAFRNAVRLVVVVEIAIDIAIVKVGRIASALTSRSGDAVVFATFPTFFELRFAMIQDSLSIRHSIRPPV
jgi:hypothetical protein